MSEASAAERFHTLHDLKVAVKNATDVYIRVHVLGGHYVRISPEDFLEAVGDMQAAGAAHPYPRRFKFTVERGIVWLHVGLLPRAAREAQKQAREQAAAGK